MCTFCGFCTLDVAENPGGKRTWTKLNMDGLPLLWPNGLVVKYKRTPENIFKQNMLIHFFVVVTKFQDFFPLNNRSLNMLILFSGKLNCHKLNYCFQPSEKSKVICRLLQPHVNNCYINHKENSAVKLKPGLLATLNPWFS